jgi:hypothetical protein
MCCCGVSTSIYILTRFLEELSAHCHPHRCKNNILARYESVLNKWLSQEALAARYRWQERYVVGEDYHALAVWMNDCEQTLDIERSSLGILDLAQLTDHPRRTLHISYRKLTICKKTNENTARTNCTSRTSRRAEMLGILATMRNSPHMTKILYSAKDFSVSKVIQITRDNRGYKN